MEVCNKMYGGKIHIKLHGIKTTCLSVCRALRIVQISFFTHRKCLKKIFVTEFLRDILPISMTLVWLLICSRKSQWPYNPNNWELFQRKRDKLGGSAFLMAIYRVQIFVLAGIVFKISGSCAFISRTELDMSVSVEQFMKLNRSFLV